MASVGTWVAGGALVFATLTVYTHFTRRSRDRARRERLRRSWGQAMERGGVEPDRPRRESIDAEEAVGRLDDQTWGDLLLGPVVAKLDRTITAVGSQTLYRWIRRPELSVETLQERDAMIEALRTDPARREQLQDVLLDFGVGAGKHLAGLLWGTIGEPSLPLPLLRLMPLALLTSIAAGVALSSLPLLGLALSIFIANIVVHYRETHTIAPMLLAMEDVGRLVLAGQGLAKCDALANAAALRPVHARIEAALPGTRPLVRRTARLDFRDPFELSEYLKTVLLMEVIRYYRAAALLRRFQPALQRLFDAVGELDAAQSAASVREDPAVVVPTIEPMPPEAQPVRIHGEDLCNPLLDDPVGNDLALPGTSLLISGSNMSGKTTYLRTVAVNAVLAQSVCLVYGAAWRGPAVRVASCISIADDLLAGRSYYRAELDAILAVIGVAEAGPSLIVLDEIFRGTNPIERTAAACAVLDHLARRHLVLAATHDLELGDRVGQAFTEAHFCEVANDEGELDFDYRLRPGRIERPNAIALLARVGYPPALVQRAIELVEGRSEGVNAPG